ncbi:MAG: fibronectin type III domain-containing protein [Eubacterium sp.]|nr:fibronectin type III domain-containing protein [Eubacterium sp.]
MISDTQNISDYNTWKNTVWNITDEEGNLKREGQAYDSGKVILTPGKTEKDLGFAWYSESKGKPAVKIGKKEDLSDAKTVEGEATDINRANRKITYKASNMVSVNNYFEENTTYYYAYTDDLAGGKWSQTFSYTSRDASKFQTVLVGDPQVGASGRTGQGTDDDINIAVDTYNWNKTVEQMKITAPNASFILSAGDQVDYSGNDETDTGNVRESEYAGFIYPDLLRNVPLATTIGNHESKGTDYQYHYNNPT